MKEIEEALEYLEEAKEKVMEMDIEALILIEQAIKKIKEFGDLEVPF